MALEAIVGTVKSLQEDKKDDSSTSLRPKDFFWDQFVKYIGSSILALTFLTVSVEFLRGGGVQCFSPAVSNFLVDPDPDELERDFTRSQSDYLNSFCTESVPNVEFFPIFILVQGILLVVPHFIWAAVFKGDFDSFFAVTENLARLRDRDTGMYDPSNFERVEKLEIEFGRKRKRIFSSYILKLFLQLGVCVVTLVFSEVFFEEFNFTFMCPRDAKINETDFPENWPLNRTVPCVFASIRFLKIVRYGDYILTSLAFILICMALGWSAIRHTKELGHQEIATFVFQSCLPAKSHVFPHIFEFRPKLTRSEDLKFPFSVVWPFCRGCIKRSFRLMILTPRIRNDLDFLQMTLFRADSSHGRVFKEIQIDKELQKLRGRDHQLIHLFLNAQLDMEALIEKRERKKANADPGTQAEITAAESTLPPRAKDIRQFFKEGGFSGNPEKYAYNHYERLLGNTEWEPVVGIRDRLYGFVKFCPRDRETEHWEQNEDSVDVKTDMAMDISFGSGGFGLVLARAFKSVVSVNFRPFLRNAANPVKKEKYYTNYVNVDFPENIFTRSSIAISTAVRQMVEPIKEEGPVRPIDFIVVGPIDEDHKRITMTLQIEMLYSTEIIEEKAILLAVRPLQIGHRKTTKRFLEYKPPIELFDHDYHEKTVVPELEDGVKKGDFKTVDGVKGITVNCGDIECVFQFVAYQFKGDRTKEEAPRTITAAELFQSGASPDNDRSSEEHDRFRHSQSIPLGPRHGAYDVDAPPQVGGVYDYGGQSTHPAVQRRNTVDASQQPQPSVGGVEQTDEFSPQAREARMKWKKLKYARKATARGGIRHRSTPAEGGAGASNLSRQPGIDEVPEPLADDSSTSWGISMDTEISDIISRKGESGGGEDVVARKPSLPSSERHLLSSSGTSDVFSEP